MLYSPLDLIDSETCLLADLLVCKTRIVQSNSSNSIIARGIGGSFWALRSTRPINRPVSVHFDVDIQKKQKKGAVQ